jgi:hypothetical protein
MAAKVIGTQHVAAAARDHGAGFLALCSSIAGLQGGFGQIDYAGANAALDAFAAWHATTCGVPTFSIDWDEWLEAGMAVEARSRLSARLASPDAAGGAGGALERDAGSATGTGIRPEDGAQAFRRIVDGRHPQVVVSTIDLLTRIADRRLTLAALVAGDTVDSATGTIRVPVGTADTLLEPRIAAVWQRVLGIEQVGWHDTFFELGGDSLAGVQVIAHLNRELGLHVTVPQFFEAPTVAALAKLVRGGDDRSPTAVELGRDRGRQRRERHERRRA